MSLRSRLEEPRTWLAISCGAFLVFYGVILHRLPHNLDEGVNLFDARFIAMGQRPYADFFYHQLPLHLYVLSLVSSVAPDSLYLHRLPALLAVAATGGVLYLLTARLASSAVAALAAAVYYAMPLQHLALLVLPNSPMLLFSTSAILLILLDERPARVTLGAVCLLLAVLWKPLALATVVIIGLLLLLDRAQRWKLVPMILVLATGAVASLVALHVLSRGGFTELLALQLHRYSRKTGFEIMQHYTTVAPLMKRLGVRSFLGWNVQSHFLAFQGHSAIVLLTAAAGGWLLWKGRVDARPGTGRLLVLWLVVPLLFSLFVWEPAWDHYHLQYLPALAILTALFFHHVLKARRRRGRVAARIGLGWTLLVGPLLTLGTLQDYGQLGWLRVQSPVLLSFDPFLNFVSGAEPACGVTDPLAQFSRPFFQNNARFLPFVRSSDQIIDCLERSPDVHVLVATMQGASLWFIDEKLYRWLTGPGHRRLIYLHEIDRQRLHASFAGGGA
jgi:4-amino-4-deoxy-L-arabinose transferase-like glycosyltransferase